MGYVEDGSLVHRTLGRAEDGNPVQDEFRTSASVVQRMGNGAVMAVSYSVGAVARGVGILTGSVVGGGIGGAAGFWGGMHLALYFASDALNRILLAHNQTPVFDFNNDPDAFSFSKWVVGGIFGGLAIGAAAGALIVDHNRGRICALGHRLASAGQSWYRATIVLT